MIIREAIIEDAPDIQNLVYSLSNFYLETEKYTHLPDWFEKTLDLSEFEQRLNSNNFINFVCTQNDQLIAYLSIKNGNHIFHLFVNKEYHRQGIAKQLWEHAIALSNNKTFTVRSSIYAIPVYESFGFKITEPLIEKDGLAFQSMRNIL